MIAEFSVFRAVVTVAFGALAGGLTNAVAIWMLFHPYEPLRLGWLTVQGALPKNKPRLARTIGRTVGQRLLTADDLVRQLRTPGMRLAFEAALRDLLRSVLETERGALTESVPETVRPEIDAVRDRIAEAVGHKVQQFVHSPAFRDTVEQFLMRARAEVADEPLSQVLTDARRVAIRNQVEQWVTEAVQSEDAAVAIRDWLERQFAQLAKDQTPLLDRLPADVVAALEGAIAGYLPVAIDHLARAVRDPETRGRLERALHGLFERFARDLLLHQRIVARLVVTERTFAKLLDSFEREGADQLAKLLEESAVRSAIAQRINDAVVQFLRRPLADHAERLGQERLAGITETTARHIVAALRDPATKDYAIERLDDALQSAERRTWGDLLRHLPPDHAAEWIARAADTPKLERWVTEATKATLDALLDRPLGRPARWLGEDGVDRLTALLTPVLWAWIEEQLPTLVARLDVEATVADKVMGFSLPRMEEIIRTATQRELDLIVRLGYVLGGIVGALAYGVSLLVP